MDLIPYFDGHLDTMVIIGRHHGTVLGEGGKPVRSHGIDEDLYISG